MTSSAEWVRRAQAALSVKARGEVETIWPKIQGLNPDRVAVLMAAVLEEVALKYGTAAAALAADFYDDLREAAGAAGVFSAVPAELPPAERFGVLARWGVTPLFGASPDAQTALTLLTGGLDRIVGNASRNTVALSVAADPAGPTYARHASANACAFCAMLASRGPVYRSAAAAGGVSGQSLGGRDYKKLQRIGDTEQNRALILGGTRDATVAQGGRKTRAGTQRPLGERYHDFCHCTVVPVWNDNYEPAPYVRQWADAYSAARSEGSTSTKQVLSHMRSSLNTN